MMIGEWLSLVTNSMFRLPPSEFRPFAMAMASSMVDLQDPFSTTKKVTLGAAREPKTLGVREA